MGRSNHIFNSFITGEVSERFFGRTDASQYNNALEDARNWIIHPQGGMSRRPGTRFIREIVSTTGAVLSQVRAFPFRGTDGSKWQIVITSENVNNHHANAGTIDKMAWNAVRCSDEQVEFIGPATYEAATVGADNYDFPTGPGWWDLGAKGVDLNEIQFAQSGDTMIFAHANMRPFKIVYQSIYVGLAKTYPPTFIPDHWAFIQTAVGDVRLNNSVLTDSQHVRAMPYGSKKTDTILTFTASGAATYFGSGGPVFCNGTLDLTTPGSTIGAAGFSVDWVGRQIKLNKGAESFVFTVTSRVSSTQLLGVAESAGKAVQIPPYPANSGYLSVTPNLKLGMVYGYGAGVANDTSFEIGLWGDGDLGWPRTVCFFEERLAFGGNKAFPDTVWFSALNNVYLFDQKGFEQDVGYATPTASDPFAQNMKEDVLTQLRFLHSRKIIIAGSDSSEFLIQGPDSAQSLSLTNTNSNPETGNGCAYLQPVRFQNATIFLQRDKRSLREMVFNLAENSYQAANLSILGEHLTKKYADEVADEGRGIGAAPGALIGIVKHDLPYGVIWCFDNNGNIFGLTREREQEIAAWHCHQICSINANQSAARVVSLSVIQAAPLFDDDGEPDELWMVVKRVKGDGLYPGTANPSVVATGQTFTNTFCLEKLSRDWERKNISAGWTSDPVVAPIYMDGAILYDSASGPTGVIAFNHGSFGDTVTVVKDGYYLGNFTLDINRQIDISAHLTAAQISGQTAWKAIVGYNYIARAVPVPPEVPTTTGSSQGQFRRVDQLSIHFKNSLGCRYGSLPDVNQDHTPLDDPDEMQFPLDRENSGDAKPLYTGLKTVNFPQGYERRPQLLIESYLPFPCTITHIVARMVASEG